MHIHTHISSIFIYIYTYIHLEPICPLFFLQKKRSFQSKQGSFRLQVQILRSLNLWSCKAAGKSQNDLALYRFYLAYRHRMSPGGLADWAGLAQGAQ